ncbi:hypothetical protein KBC89_03985 [Candidatus Woesebacteria bacterium]|nr:hypothetical protein [Candidatus Woesebacteria bacterium]
MEANAGEVKDMWWYFKQRVKVHAPETDRSLPIYRRAFYVLEDVKMDFPSGGESIAFDLITTEEHVDQLSLQTTELANRSPYKRMLDHLGDRLTKFNPDSINIIKKLIKDNPGKKGAVILAHGNNYQRLDIPFGLLTSATADGQPAGILPAQEAIKSIQDEGKYSFVVMLSCNPGEQIMNTSEITMPLIYYLTDNAPIHSDKPVKVAAINIDKAAEKMA